MQKKLAIVGFGEMGKRHGRDFIELSRGAVKLQAVVEPDDVRYAEGCDWTGCRPARYDSVQALLAGEIPDGIIVSAPNHCHLASLLELEKSAIPLLLEKPLDSTFDKICGVLRFARRYPAPIMVHHVMRYAPIVRKARELITSGALGRVCSANFTQTIAGASMYHNFRRNMQTGGGQLIEKATHDLDVMLFLMGRKPRRVSALSFQQAYGGDKPDTLRCCECPERATCREYSARGMAGNHGGLRDVAAADDLCVFARATDIPDNETCTIVMDENTFGVYSHCFFARGLTSREYQVIGTEACMRIIFSQMDGPPDGRIILTPRYDDVPGRIQEYRFAYHGRIHYNGAPGVVRHFTELMSGARQPFTTVEQAFTAELIGCAAYSSQGGAWVDLQAMLPEDLADA